MKPHLILMALGLLALPTPAWAEEPGDTSDLEGLLDTAVVSAPSKAAETTSIAPATSLVLTADDLRRHGIYTIDEAINFLGYGMVTERKFHTSEIGSRGVLITSDFGGHVLLLVDGHVMNEPWGSTAYFDRGTGIPFELIDHIELVLGPGSVLYGSNAMLGIVHIVTKRAKDFRGLHLGAETEASVLAPGFGMRGSAGFGHEFELFGAEGEVVFGAEYFRQRGPTFDFAPQDYGPDDFTGERRHFDPKRGDRRYPVGVWGGRGDDAYFIDEPAAYLRLRLGQFEINTRAAFYKRSEPTNSGNFDDPDSYELDRWLSLDVKHVMLASAAVRVSTRLYGDLYDYVQYWGSTGAEDCIETQDYGCMWRLKGATQSAGLEPQVSLDWLEDGRFVTLLGADGRVKHIESQVDYIDYVTARSPGPIGAYAPTEMALAAYAQQTLRPVSWAAINAGARLDVDDRFGSHGSPRAALTFMPYPGGSLKAIYSEAFRAPAAFDIYYYDPTTQLPGGKKLGPEIVRSYEGSIEQRFGTQTLELGVFYTRWNDLLSGYDLSDDELAAKIASGELAATAESAVQIRNIWGIENYGLNAGYRGSLLSGRLRYGAGLTEAHARREDPGQAPSLLTVAPSLFGNARVSYDLGGALPTVALAARWVGRRPNTDYPKEGFARPLVELRGAISGPIADTGFSYRATGNYVTSSRGPYGSGPATLASGKTDHNPIDQLRLGLGLAYDLPF
jgi:outer membrane receptor for ferrienterochelin and colicins